MSFFPCQPTPPLPTAEGVPDPVSTGTNERSRVVEGLVLWGSFPPPKILGPVTSVVGGVDESVRRRLIRLSTLPSVPALLPFFP